MIAITRSRRVLVVVETLLTELSLSLAFFLCIHSVVLTTEGPPGVSARTGTGRSIDTG
jgi:hypothetical protein